MIKIILKSVLRNSAILLIVAAALPLVYICFLIMTVVVPPWLFATNFYEDRQNGKPLTLKGVSAQFASEMIALPLVLFAIAGILRAIILAGASIHPTALFIFNEFDNDVVFALFIPIFGDMFRYWADLYWGICGVGVAFTMPLLDSIRRSKLVRQIEILPTSKVHAAAIGLVELKGKAIPVDGLQDDPIILQRVVKTGDDLYGTETTMKPFYLDDGTGRILVDPRGASVDAEGYIFDTKMHHAVLKSHKRKNGLSESRLMPGENVYVLGNLQINRGHSGESDRVIIKPEPFSLRRPNFYDPFFVSNLSEERLLAAFTKSIKPGWSHALVLILLPTWLSMNAWTHIVQIETMDIEAAPAFFRLVTPATVLEREITVGDLGMHPNIHWIGKLKQGHGDAHDDIMWALKDQRLAWLVIPTLLEQAQNIDHPAFGAANYWLQRLKASPKGHWGLEYTAKKRIENAESKGSDNTFVHRVLLQHNTPELKASWRVFYVKFHDSIYVKFSGRAVVFKLTDKESGAVQRVEFDAAQGWNQGNDELLFDHFLQGEYSFDIYAARRHEGGGTDTGTWQRKAIDISF